ncbi:MAG: U32 family peptidase [Firmicutes bacterium]|nr:U32 family peptidase [Bacillota bacterium]
MKKLELLAPAGRPEQFKAAVNAGADAVYLGGSLFNARIGAGNFTLDEIRDAVDYGHLRNVKTYVTLNTLMDEKDIPKAVNFASELYMAGVDALIIQDWGLGYALKSALPGMDLHLSTQATVTSPRGVRAAQKLGYKRIVLARELSLDEIRACAEAGEVEVFVHGALCMCYSGQCQLSRFIGGRSGNKGLCAQPCRLPYVYRDKNGRKLPTDRPLSPRDLCLIDHLGELIDAGVSSFKIEGRMKSPEYVATVVSIYRKYIDEYLSAGLYEVTDEDRTALLQAFNRDGFTDGYLSADPDRELMTTGMSKNTGVLVGTVSKILKNGLIEIDPVKDISMHDVLEIRGLSDTSFKVTFLETLSGGRLKLGDVKDVVYAGDEIYRLISKDLTDKAYKIITNEKTAPVDMYLLAKAGLPIKLSVRDLFTGASVTVSDPDLTVQPAVKAATDKAAILRQLRKTGGTAFSLNKADIILDSDVFLPVSWLNALRRQALEELKEEKLSRFRHACPEESHMISGISQMLMLSDDIETIVYDKIFDLGDEAVILPQVLKGPYNEWLEDNYQELSGKAAATGAPIVVSDIGWIEPLAEAGAKVIGGPGLNITDPLSVKALMELGMSDEYVSSPELLTKDMMDGVPLMITEHRMTPGTLTDRKGAEYSVEFDETTHKSYIFAK